NFFYISIKIQHNINNNERSKDVSSYDLLENAVSFSQPTAGYATANAVYDFPDGSYLMLTIAQDMDRNGEVYGDSPIAPDHVVDDELAAAQTWLSRQGCR